MGARLTKGSCQRLSCRLANPESRLLVLETGKNGKKTDTLSILAVGYRLLELYLYLVAIS